jgi:uncharacterized protein
MSTSLPRQNNAAEIQAFQDACDRLAGFDAGLHWEFVDGWLCGLASGPSLPPHELWLESLCGDTFDRVFADPPDRAQALRALRTRLAVLREQLDPDRIMDDPDALQIDPLVADWTPAAREALRAAGTDAQSVAACQLGLAWAEGAIRGIGQAMAQARTLGVAPQALHGLEQALAQPAEAPLPADTPLDEEPTALLRQWTAPLRALTCTPESAAWRAFVQAFHEGREPAREDVLGDAILTLQDLRVWWVDQIPLPGTRRNTPAPGRNDPCPCGSGRKFKKCHGAG